MGDIGALGDPIRAEVLHEIGIAELAADELGKARCILERAVALDPNASAPRNDLAILLQKLGRPDLARVQYVAALALAPDNAHIHSNLASALVVLGRYDQALAHIRRALELQPGLASAHVHAAVVESERGRPDAALGWIDAILPTSPDNVEMLLVRANILRRLDRCEEGLAACQQALALAPSHDRGHNILALMLRSLGRDEEALAAYEKAASLSTTPGIPLANRATLLIELGRKREAAALLDRAIATHPDAVELWYARGQLRQFAAEPSDVTAMETMLTAERAATHHDRLYLHYTLGGAYLAAGDPERAFTHFAAGAAMKRATIRYDAAETERWIADIAAAFPREIFAGEQAGTDMSELPIFVVGMPRTGTTLVEQILASHPAIHGAGETPHLDQAIEHTVTATGSAPFPNLVRSRGRGPYDEIARDYLSRVTALAPAASRIVDKKLHNFFYAGLIHLALPRARIIHCRRHPLDTCLSCFSTLFSIGQEFSYDLVELGRHYRAYDALAAHWRAVLPAGLFVEIDYESVVEDLDAAARRLIAFCGLPWSPACLRFHETERPVRTASMTQVRRPLYPTSVGRWRDFRTQLAPLIDALGPSIMV